MRAPTALDFNGDGAIDVAYYYPARNTTSLFANEGGALEETQIISGQLKDFGDFDGDGDVDLLVADGTYKWTRFSDGKFTEPIEIVTPVDTTQVIARDIDGDGDKDLLATSKHDTDGLWASTNDGSGTFLAWQLLAPTGSSHAIDTADIDSDGDLDILVGGSGDNSLVVVSNDLDGVFHVRETIRLEFAVSFVKAFDLGGDGDIDVATWSEFSGVHLFENSAGSFESTRLDIPELANISMSTSDLNLDGIPDLLVGSPLDLNEVYWSRVSHKVLSEIRSFYETRQSSPRMWMVTESSMFSRSEVGAADSSIRIRGTFVGPLPWR